MNLSLYYPVKPHGVNQVFGNKDPKYTALGLLGHNGIDLFARHGEPVYASHDGLAQYEIDTDSGHGVVITTNTTFDYKGQDAYYKTIYWHFCDSTKEPQFRSPIEGHADGVQVKAGDLIGYADNTGLSTGDHCHWGLKPMRWSSLVSDYVNIEQDNGYLGSIDPTPYCNGLFAEDINHVPSTYVFNTDMGYGETSEDVRQLQLRLQVTPTGYFGFKTLTAVVWYQVSNSIFPITGFVGPKTRAKLNS